MHENTTVRSLFVIGIVIISVFVGVTIPSAVAAQETATNGTTTENGTSTANGTMASTSLTPNSTAAGVVSNHTVTITIDDAVADNLTEVRLNYTGTNVSTAPALENVSISIANQSIAIPTNATVGASNYGESGYPAELVVSFALNQSLQPEAGDQLTLSYPVQHPSEPGNYTVDILLNPGTDAVALTTNLTVTPSEATPTPGEGTAVAATTTGATTTGATTTGGTPGTTTMAGTTGTTTMAGTTEGETGGGTAGGGTGGTATSSGNGPGFSVLVGIVAILAVALLATRRN